jgi:EAL and modified HD-GYP domain-containing signal transduction protein
MFDKLLRRLVKREPTETDGDTLFVDVADGEQEAEREWGELENPEESEESPDAPPEAADTVDAAEVQDDLLLSEATALNFTFICRETVVDRTQKVVGYEYLLRNNALQREQFSDPVQQHMDEQALLTRLVSMDLARLLEYRYTFITLSAQVILRPVVERLPAEVCVLLIRADSFGNLVDPNLIARIAHLRRLGYGFGLVVNDRSIRFVDQLHHLVHYVVVDLGAPNPSILLKGALRGMRRWPETQLLIRDIADVETFNLCSKALVEHIGIHLFQGTFLTQRLPWRSDHVDAGKARIVALLNGIKQQHDTPILVEGMRHDPLLLSRLLRYANSAATNPLSKVNSAERALAVMGRESLYRLLTVLLFCSGDISDRDMAIMDTALIRARFAETLGAEHLSREDCDNLFLVGMFSLLDVLLRVPAEEALPPLELVPEVMEALLGRSGRFACYLDLVIACEHGDQERVALCAAQCDVSEGTVNGCHMEAILWAQELARI